MNYVFLKTISKEKCTFQKCFLMEYLQTDERYTLPLILFTLEETKKDIKSITDNISNDSRQPINKVDLLERIDDLIAFVSNNNK